MRDKDNYSSSCWFGCKKCLECKYMKLDTSNKHYEHKCAKGKTVSDKRTFLGRIKEMLGFE